MQSPSNSTPQSPTSSQTEVQSAAQTTVDPLEEASPSSLEELMNRAPQISDAEADQIIAYLRAQREKFAQQEATPKVKKAPKAKGPKPTLSVDELLSGLD